MSRLRFVPLVIVPLSLAVFAPACSDKPTAEPSPVAQPSGGAQAPVSPPPAEAEKKAGGEASDVTRRRTAFQLGWRLTMAAIANSSGDAEMSAKTMRKAELFAGFLDVQVPALPAPSEKGLAGAVGYLLDATKTLAAEVERQNGPQTAGGLKLALQIGLLSKLWSDEKLATATLKQIVLASREAGVPDDVLQPLVAKAATRPDSIVDDVFSFKDRVDEFLKAAPDEARGLRP